MVETMNGLVCILCLLGIVLFASIWFFIKATIELNQIKQALLAELRKQQRGQDGPN